jgi:DNA-binding LacI/PurR family transcriptional regulator
MTLRRGKSMSVSIYDIAKKAKVSPSTVSRALQDHPRIAEKTKQRIQKIARELEYVPSTVARSLIANRTWTIGMVLASISDPFMGRVVEGVEQIAIEAGFNVFLSTSQNNRERELAVIDVFQQRRVDGIIVLASHLLDEHSVYANYSNVPIVVINEQDPGKPIHFVSVDDVQGTRLAVEHLIGLGHRRIGYIGVANRPRSNQHRLRGYREALTAHAIAFDPALIFTGGEVEDHARRGEAALEVLLAAGATAVFCYNDTTAIGLLSACYARGLVVPERFSVIGFDDIDGAAYTIPPLTTIRQPRFELGRLAMRMMLDILDGQQAENKMLRGELIERSTTAQLAPGQPPPSTN